MSELVLIKGSQKNKQAIRELIFPSLLTAFSFILGYFPNTISIYFIEYKEQDSVLVGALGLGILITQAVGMGLLNGIATGLETLVSQAYGGNQFELCAKLYYRSLFVCTLFMIPISLFLFFSTQWMSLINSNEQLVNEAGKFNKYMILGVYLDAIFVNTKVFLNGQNIYNYQFFTQLISCVFFFGMSYYFIVQQGMGIIGCSLGWTCFEIANNILLFAFIFATKCCDATLFRFKISYLHNTIKFLKEAIPIGSILLLEWISYDIYLIIVSYLDESSISAHVLMGNFASFIYQFSYGISIASTTFIGNEMGRKDTVMAKSYAKATFLIAIIFLVITLGFFSIFGKQLIEKVSHDKAVVEEIQSIMYLLTFFIFIDGLQAIISGLVRAVGREASASFTFIFCYLILGEAVGYLFCYTLDFKLTGIWIGMTVGSLTYDIIQFINLIWKNWNEQAELIEKKITSLHQLQVQLLMNEEDI
ncbi:unnamed protein product (macronuclear) [Paramecium tetraurelia]|uniref:Uncharacterized protein n=1 Tax=Paramecium tetraurelia TaxID=5888 RepID=A0C3A3_PARTE|nr:uncharacterized protein GSPATT00034749001 [Paramecium tetraurelia]CAK65270.1 unnamed protein product [Paramecium tetraurelia]|eukprot:XP_001432667.1 hypothetical protein (macronuclear) [Paramecium tetraurelia strain d4-2]